MEIPVNTTLQLMEQTMVCAICKELYKTPVLLIACSHNFCSICIRRYFSIKQECPICGLDASSGGLVPNRILDTLTKHVENLRGLLDNGKETASKKFVKVKEADDANTSLSNSITIGDSNKPCVLIDHMEIPKTVLPLCEASLSEDCSVIDNTPDFSLGLKEFCTQSQGFSSACQSSESHDMFTDHQPIVNAIGGVEDRSSYSDVKVISSSSNISSEITTPINTVNGNLEPSNATCPVCGMPVATSTINSHLDNCLAREEKKKALRQNTPKRLMRNKPIISKLAYNLLSLKTLRSKLKEIGLPTKGDKVELKRRHQEFLAKYQAEHDKVDPRSTDVLIAELNREETRRKHLGVHLSPQKNTRTSNNKEALGRQEHMEKYAKQYQQLEEVARKSLPSKRKGKRKLEDCGDDCSEAGCSSDADLADNKRIPFFKTAAQRRNVAVSMMTDSDEICPDSQSNQSGSFGSLDITSLHRLQEDPRPVSPELYVMSVEEEPRTLKTAIEEDSQAEDIKLFIDASLS